VPDLRGIVRLVQDDLDRVEDLFQEPVPLGRSHRAEIGRYIQEGGGKRIRPTLLLLGSGCADTR